MNRPGAPLQKILGAVLMLATAGTLLAQTLPPSTVTLTASPSPLVLPGSLNLNATANQTPVAGGVPTGTVNFFADGTTLLGKGDLRIIPSTQTFSETANGYSTSLPSGIPIGLAFTTLAKGSVGVVSGENGAVLNPPLTGSLVTLAIYTNPITTTLTQFSYTPSVCPFQRTTCLSGIDAVGSGFFLQPKSSGIRSFLVHAQGVDPTLGVSTGQYLVFDGTVAAQSLNPPKVVSDSGCNCSSSDVETIAIDDFDGDGYSDVGLLTQEDNGLGNIFPVTGITLNSGVSNPGNFQLSSFNTHFILAPTPSTFCPVAITTGRFTSAAGAQLAVLGRNPVSGNCTTLIPSDPSTIFLYALDSSKTQLVQVGSLTTDPGATSLAATDLNLDGKLDLVIGESGSGGLKTAFGNGDGTFSSPSALISTLGPPVSFSINDFDGDGSPDIAVALGNQGGLAVLFNDGAGNFQTAPKPVNLSFLSTPVGIASGDLNADGLPDLEVLLPPGLVEGSVGGVDFLLNSAAAQATLTPASPLLPAGTHILTATFPGDTNFAPSTSAPLTEVVNKGIAGVSWPAPAAIDFGTALSSTQLNASANIPGTFTYSQAIGTVLPLGSNMVTATFTPTDTFNYGVSVTTQSINVTVPAAAVTLSAAAMISAGQQASVTLTVSPFPVALTAKVTLTFTPAPPNTVGDPAILFSNNNASASFDIPANSTAAIPPFPFNAGSTAGRITVSLQLTDGAVDVTPPSFAPVSIIIPAEPPVFSRAALTRNGHNLQIVLHGFSTPRDVTQAQFHFTAVRGKSLKTPDVTVPLTAAFQAWYQSAASSTSGTTVTYTQPFSINGDAADIASVTIILSNSQGPSQPLTVQ